MMYLIPFLFFFAALEAFYDEALVKVWSSIADINNPTLEEYHLLEDYLHNQRRFLDVPNPGGYIGRLNAMKNIKLLGPEDRMPLFEKQSFRIHEGSKNRCILLYASYNGAYTEKARCLISELDNLGYSGHILLRFGGFPNTQNGGLKLCHVPYSFKLAFLQEAKALGYKEVLWMDLALHPMTNLELIFSEIRRKGYFFTSVGSLQDNAPGHRPEAAEATGISTDLYSSIPHLSSSMIGLNMENKKALQLLEDWHSETIKVMPCISWFPEELSLSVVAWRLGCKPYSWFGTLVCSESEVTWLPFERPTIQLYIDSRR